MRITSEPIGFVRGERVEADDDCWGGVVSEIVIEEGLGAEARSTFPQLRFSQTATGGRTCAPGSNIAVMVEQASRIGPKVVKEAPPPDVGDALIAYLRTELGDASLAYAAAPSRITGGFDTTIYSFTLGGADGEMAGPLILRVYRDGVAEQARYETIVQNAVAAQGFPTPRVLISCVDPSVMGSAFVIMPRVPGAPMLNGLFSTAMPRLPVVMAKLHARLHALDPEPVRLAIVEAGWAFGRTGTSDYTTWRSEIERAKLEGLRDACAWVETSRPPTDRAPAVCHGDFHPLNVLMDGDLVSGVLDWPMMRIADPAWDVGAAIALFGHGPIDLPRPVVAVVNVIRNWLLRRYVKAYLAERPLDAESVRYYEAMRLLGFMLETGSYRQAQAGVVPPTTKATAFNHPRVLRGIAKRFTKVTGVAVTLPEFRG